MLATPLIDFHRSAEARLVDFAGWEMPVVYTSIVEEHHYTRRHASVFDVSHMGRVEFRGPDAGRLLERLNTRDIGSLAVGQSRYSHMCREDGGILDDVIVSRLEDRYLVVCNASNREKLLGWWERQRAGADVEIVDRTFETGMVAVQGPEAVETLDALLPMPVSDLKNYRFKSGAIMGASYLIARSGYTGEDGAEIILPAKFVSAAMNLLIERSAEIGRPVRPAGLGARDTLRTEAGMPLYGHELCEAWDPLTAGQSWVVKLEKDFIGRDAIARVKEAGPERVLCGFAVEGKRTPRQGAPILAPDGTAVGAVSSGVKSPTLDRVVAMGFVPPALSARGARVLIEVGASRLDAVVAPLPFYKR